LRRNRSSRAQPGFALEAGDWVPGQIIEVRYRLDSDLVQGADYSAGGTIALTVVPGFTYTWTKGTNDTSLTYNGATVLAASGTFTPTTSATVTLTGTANLPSGGTLVAASNYWQMMNTLPDPALALLTALRLR
jgi:hypothetical protein